MWSLWLLLAAIALLLIRLVSQGKTRQTEEKAVREQAQVKEAEALADSRVCPKCAETVKRAAKVCRFCGYELPEPPPAIEDIIAELERLGCSPDRLESTSDDLLDRLDPMLADYGCVMDRDGGNLILRTPTGRMPLVKSDEQLVARLRAILECCRRVVAG